MERYIVPIIVVALWFLLWAKDTGLLIFAKVETVTTSTTVTVTV